MEQADLWHDSILDAIGAAVRAAGGPGTVAKKLWPALEQSSRTARLRGCLSPDHAQKLDPEELLLIAKLARDAGDHSIMRYMARELAYETPTPISPTRARKRALKGQAKALITQAVVLLEQIGEEDDNVEHSTAHGRLGK